MMTRVSVVIPSYNHAAFIREAVDSVLVQSESNLEIIVVDDGSTDKSLEVLSGFTDPRLHVICQNNQGAHAAINRGLNQATGEFLAILNSDDSYHPQRLEKALTALEADSQVGLVGSYIRIIDAQNETLGIKHGFEDCEPWSLETPERSFRASADLRAALLTENYWSTTSNFVFSRKWYELTGEFRPLRFAHDWDFTLRMARIADLKLIPEPLVNYRVHGSNTIREDQAAMIFEICWCLAVHIPSHIADTRFFDKIPLNIRIEQLLHSIYVFGCERVLSVLLLQRLHGNSEQALELLDTENPVRKEYLDFIQKKLASQSNSGSIEPENFSGDVINTTGGSNQRLSNTMLLSYRKLRSWIVGALKQ